MASLQDGLKGGSPFGFMSGSLQFKLLTAILVLSLLPLALYGALSSQRSGVNQLDSNTAVLQSVAAVTGDRVLTWFEQQRTTLQGWSRDPMHLAAFRSLVVGVRDFSGGDIKAGSSRARELYLYQPGLADSGDESPYSQSHATYHDHFTSLVTGQGFLDLYLVHDNGTIVYTVRKADTFGSNLMNGPYKETGLGQAFRGISQAKNSDTVLFTDFTASNLFDAPTGFFSTRVRLLGTPSRAGAAADSALTMIVAVGGKQLTNLLQVAGGASHESYLVGPDNLWRSESIHAKALSVASTLLNPAAKLTTGAAKAVLSGTAGGKVTEDYLGKAVLSSWRPLVVESGKQGTIKWGLVCQIEEEKLGLSALPGLSLMLLFIPVVLVLAIFAVRWLTKPISQQINSITFSCGEIGTGDLAARAEVNSLDELGELADTFNEMLDNLTTQVQSRDERDAIQSSIMQLLDEVSEVANGDLTVQAEVSTDMTGAIADAFNYMTAQLRDIISNVHDTTIQVSSSANEIHVTSEHLARGSEAQAEEIANTTAAIDEMAASIKQVSENASLSATVGEQALESARQGTEAVQDTIGMMNSIRDQVQETAKRIKRLGESSQEIGEIVRLIGDIADRTSILALNASIQAAMAGEAGRGFGVVAEEVERLAERSTSATKQVDGLIKTIQTEMSQAVAAMEETTREVVDGSQVADTAGQALTEIEGVSIRLAELIQSISQASKQQARGSEALAESMVEIADVTQQAAAGNKQAVVSINNLANLADDLRDSISTFKLPETD